MFASQSMKSNRAIVLAAAVVSLTFASAVHAQQAPGSIEAANRIAGIVTAYETQAPERAVTVKLQSTTDDTATFVTSVSADAGHRTTCHLTLVKAPQANQLGWEAKQGSCKFG
jgi:hypothetical protein